MLKGKLVVGESEAVNKQETVAVHDHFQNHEHFHNLKTKKKDELVHKTELLSTGIQQAKLVVKNGYNPTLIEGLPNIPIQLIFDRQEEAGCSNQVKFPDLQIQKELPAYSETKLELPALQEGNYKFTCGMDMIEGMVRIRS